MMVLASTMRMRKVDKQMSKMSISGNSQWAEIGRSRRRIRLIPMAAFVASLTIVIPSPTTIQLVFAYAETTLSLDGIILWEGA